MSDVCPSCERIVGKLYLTCRWCGVPYCEDCIQPKVHYCPSYHEKDNNTVHPTKVSSHISSDKACEDFAKEFTDYENDEPFLSLLEIKKRVSEGLDTLDMYICPRCLNVRDNERYACVHCNNGRTIKCDWCGNHFCEVCIKPETHFCSQYSKHLREIENQQRRSIYTKPEPVAEPVTKQIPETVHEPLAKLTPEPVQDILNKTMEAVKVESKLSLWRRLFSIFGLGK